LAVARPTHRRVDIWCADEVRSGNLFGKSDRVLAALAARWPPGLFPEKS
jgi:hypothetical protein